MAATGLTWGQVVELPGKRTSRMRKDAWALISRDAPPDIHDAGTYFEFHETNFSLSYVVDESNRLIGFQGNNMTRGVAILEDLLSLYGPAIEMKGLNGGGLEVDAYVWTLEGGVHAMLVIAYMDRPGETSPHAFADLGEGTATVERYRAAYADLVVLKDSLL